VEKPILNNPDQFPTDEVIFSCIGKTKTLWIVFFEYIQEKYPEFSQEWRYYKDGNNWLMKVSKKSKTIFWVSVWKDTFKVGFYFGDKAEEDINNSEISDELKEQFKNGKRYGKIRGLSIRFKNEQDIEHVKSLIPIRIKK